MDHPVGPVYLLDGGDVMVFEPARVASELEPWMIDQPVALYDDLGRPLRVVAAREVRKRWRLVQGGDRRSVALELASSEPEERRLRDALVQFLEQTGRTIPDEDTFQGFTTAVGRLIV